VSRGSTSGATCPDIFELEDGSFAVIGKLSVPALYEALHSFGAVLDEDETVVRIPRQVLLDAKKDIPDV
jgi:hypothetical protein